MALASDRTLPAPRGIPGWYDRRDRKAAALGLIGVVAHLFAP
jgi:hypothetical protein